MERETISVGQSITVGEATLLPLVRTVVRCQESGGGVVCSGLKHVTAVVVLSPEGTRALNGEGEEVPVEQYVQKVPGLRNLL